MTQTAMESLHVPTWAKDGCALVVVETPKGTPNKLKLEPAYRAFTLSKVLPAGMVFPFDFGFLPGTKAADGDPLDVLLLMDAPVYPGCVVPARLVGVIEAEQMEPEGWLRNDRIVAVADCSPTQSGVRSLKDLDRVMVDQIEAFFTDYNRVEGKEFRPLRRRGPRTARRLVDDASVGRSTHGH